MLQEDPCWSPHRAELAAHPAATAEITAQKSPKPVKVVAETPADHHHPFSWLCLPQERKLCAFPFIEVCGSDVIKYMAPLSRQTDFFVPEMKEEVKPDVKEEDSDEDRGTDITGETAGLGV